MARSGRQTRRAHANTIRGMNSYKACAFSAEVLRLLDEPTITDEEQDEQRRQDAEVDRIEEAAAWQISQYESEEEEVA